MITPIETAWHIIVASMIFAIGLYVVLRLTRKITPNKKMPIALYLWHTLFAIIYMYYTLTAGGDSLGYYNAALNGDIELEFGTRFVEYFAFLLVSFLGVSYLGLFLFFNIFGSLGLIILYASLSSVTIYCSKRVKQLTLLVVFLPSISFWSSALGKDSISFLAATLALWAVLNIPKRKIIMSTAIMLMLLVRPHMAGIMVIALALSLIAIGRQINLSKRMMMGILLVSVIAALVPFAANYAGIQNYTDLNAVTEYIETRQSYNMDGGGGIDISGMSLPMQLFTYLFRPLPYEAHSLPAFMASLDNLVLLLLFLHAIRFTHLKSNTQANHAFLWLYVIGATLVLATTTANLGISVRQKWMIMPMLLYLLFAGIAAHQARKQYKKQRKTYRVTPERLSLR